jgi:hypothetical protein
MEMGSSVAGTKISLPRGHNHRRFQLVGWVERSDTHQRFRIIMQKLTRVTETTGLSFACDASPAMAISMRDRRSRGKKMSFAGLSYGLSPRLTRGIEISVGLLQGADRTRRAD